MWKGPIASPKSKPKKKIEDREEYCNEWVIVKGSMAVRVMLSSPQGIYILISRFYECVTLHEKRDFANVTKLRSWDGEIILDYFTGPNEFKGILIRGKQEDQNEDGNVMTNAEVIVGERNSNVLYCWNEDRGVGHKSSTTGSF